MFDKLRKRHYDDPLHRPNPTLQESRDIFHTGSSVEGYSKSRTEQVVEGVAWAAGALALIHTLISSHRKSEQRRDD